MGFSRQECWSGLPFLSPEDLPNPGVEPKSPTLDRRFAIWATNNQYLHQWWMPIWVINVIITHSVQFSSVAQSCLTLCDPMNCRMPGLPVHQKTPGFYPNSCPLSQWCHPTISSSVVPFSSDLQSFPASGSFQMSQFFASGGQSIRVSASTSVLPMNTQDWSLLGWTGWISWKSKGLSRVFSNTTVQKHQFFGAQPSSQSNSHIHTWLLEKPQPWLDGPLLAK